eukprot:2677972-Ditylum_brightwellii.AAC.1
MKKLREAIENGLKIVDCDKEETVKKWQASSSAEIRLAEASLRFESWSGYRLSRRGSKPVLKKLLGLQNHLVIVRKGSPYRTNYRSGVRRKFAETHASGLDPM